MTAIAVSALVLVGSVAILEVALRATFAKDVNQAALRHPPHPFLQVDASSLVAVNDHGFRGDPIERGKPPGVFRVFALGGSTTLGIGAPYEDTYPYKLQTMLRERYPDVAIEVQNAGSAWYTTAHMLINYQLRVRQFDPDLVVVFEAINDLYRSFSPPWWAVGEFKPDYSHYLGPYIRFLGPDVWPVASASWWPGSELLVWRRLRDRVRGVPTPYRFDAANLRKLRSSLQPRPVASFKSLDSFRSYYALLIRTIQADGRPVLMASQAFLYSDALPRDVRESLFFAPIFCAEDGAYPTMESMMRGMDMFNDAARTLAGARGIPFLEFERAVPKTRVHFSDDVHLTGAGNEIVARMVFDWIVAQAMIEARPGRWRGPAPTAAMPPSSRSHDPPARAGFGTVVLPGAPAAVGTP
ncbi:MAG TPA: SGNH/GDSL hydrolase family protein [Candidatus Binatia bacterium]|nr:SGNH/GDSL hydrolase family protein [Candidatus Binatia bacterium]